MLLIGYYSFREPLMYSNEYTVIVIPGEIDCDAEGTHIRVKKETEEIIVLPVFDGDDSDSLNYVVLREYTSRNESFILVGKFSRFAHSESADMGCIGSKKFKITEIKSLVD